MRVGLTFKETRLHVGVAESESDVMTLRVGF